MKKRLKAEMPDWLRACRRRRLGWRNFFLLFFLPFSFCFRFFFFLSSFLFFFFVRFYLAFFPCFFSRFIFNWLAQALRARRGGGLNEWVTKTAAEAWN